MKALRYLKTILILVLFLAVFILNKNIAFSDARDAISIRVMPNHDHYSILKWYNMQGFKGSPQTLTVDGYDAIRSGRTVYVNVGNIVSERLFTNIYMISFNQEAEKETVDIFGKILANWKFNTNIPSNGFCNEDELEVYFDAEDGPDLTITTLDGTNNVYHRVNNGTVLSSDFLPVDTLKTYKLSGDFKSVGPTLSKLYFGVATYDKDFNFIDALHVLRQGNDATILSFSPTSITVNTALSGWRDNSDRAGERSLGFYYLGDITKPPQDIFSYYPSTLPYTPPPSSPCGPLPPPATSCYYSTWSSFGAYNGATINGSTIIPLNAAIPTFMSSRIIPGITKIQNHYSGGGYNYSAANSVDVPSVWTEFREDDITGEEFGNDPDKFRPGTRYVKIVLLLNYKQWGGEEIYFDNVYFIEDGITPKFKNSIPFACDVQSDCQKLNLGYCVGPKPEIRRDTRRLADLTDIKISLDEYKKKNGIYPKINSGSYLPNKTISTWPSWQKELGKELKIGMPTDPINELGDCSAPGGYDTKTCWNERTKKFASNLEALELPNTSHAYIYKVSEDGESYDLCSFTESGYVLEVGGNCESTGGTITASVSGANRNPRFISSNIPIFPIGAKLEGFIQAIDPDGDSLTWSINTTPGNPWTNWSAEPVLQSTPVDDQMMISADSVGDENIYNIEISVNDGKGGTATQMFQINVVDYCGNGVVDIGEECDPMETKSHFENRVGKILTSAEWATVNAACTASCVMTCADADGDGHGICPNCGTPRCAFPGNDCEDSLNGADGIFGTLDDGANINPSAVDNCLTFDDIDNNCNGFKDEGATTDNILTNINFENGPVGGYPVDWTGTSQVNSSVGITNIDARSGSQSVLIHQDPGKPYPGVCSQTNCESPDLAAQGINCTWLAGPSQCQFTNPDTCHTTGPVLYNSGETFCWPNTYRTMYSHLIYDISSFPFVVGDTYIVRFYYKGELNAESSARAYFSYTPSWINQCFNLITHAYLSCDATYGAGFADVCSTQPTHCCIHANSAANQQSCYDYKQMYSIPNGAYPDWSLYADSFVYTAALAESLDDSGAVRHTYGFRVGYNSTGPGSDIYIDDFQLIRCQNVP